MMSELEMVLLVAVMGGPRLVQHPEAKSPVYNTWYCWPGTAAHVKLIMPGAVVAAGRSNGLGMVTVRAATLLVTHPQQLEMTTV